MLAVAAKPKNRRIYSVRNGNGMAIAMCFFLPYSHISQRVVASDRIIKYSTGGAETIKHRRGPNMWLIIRPLGDQAGPCHQPS